MALQVVYFHHAHGHEPQALELKLDESGAAQRTVSMRYEGIWEFHCTATLGEQSFTQSTTQSVSSITMMAAVPNMEPASASDS